MRQNQQSIANVIEVAPNGTLYDHPEGGGDFSAFGRGGKGWVVESRETRRHRGRRE